MSHAYHHGDLRNALLDVALDLIREQGVSGFTLREVARRARVSHAAPYRHFRDKADLAAAIAEDGFKALQNQMDRAVATKRNPARRLQAAGRAYVKLALERPEHFRVMFATQIDPETHPAARAAAQSAFAGLFDLVVACQETGEIRPGDPLTFARICWSQVHGIAQLAIDKQFAFAQRKEILTFTERALELLVEGLRIPSARRPK